MYKFDVEISSLFFFLFFFFFAGDGVCVGGGRGMARFLN